MRWTKTLVLNTFISLLAGLDKDRFYSFDELSITLGCSRGEIERVTDSLCNLTVKQPGESGEGSYLPIVRTDEGITLCSRFHVGVDRPVRLDAAQMMAVLLALRMAGIAFDDERMSLLSQAVSVDAASAGTVSPAALASLIDADIAPYPTHFADVLVRAALDGCCVWVRYRGVERIFEPVTLIWENDIKYVYGFCRTRDTMRTLRLDTIEEIALLEAEPATFKQTALSESRSSDLDVMPGIGAPLYNLHDAAHTARLRFADPTDFIAEQWPGARLQQTTQSGAHVDVPYDRPEWLARQVVARLGAVTIEDSGEDLREAVCAYGQSLIS